ncbi:MAG: hypothetical protein CMN76_12440 [Spirochaetaceae bacterium]|nr:hypothetical protein [Spirochaetaceae bacterium]|tara:strand:- start:53099 stop:54583 length:1485 start_codon:yes stop_codon:yes gene_type:complete
MRVANVIKPLFERRLFLAAFLTFIAGALHADTVILKNGVIIEGVVYDQNPYMLRIQKDQGAAITIRKSQVIRVIYGDRVETLEEKKREKKQEPTPAKREPVKEPRPKPAVDTRKEPPKRETTEKKTVQPEKSETNEPEVKTEPEVEKPADETKEQKPEIIRRPVSSALADPNSSRFIANLKSTPPGLTKKELSRAHSLIYGEGDGKQELILRDRPHSPVIDLNRIVVGPVDPDKEGRLRIHTDDEGQPVALVEVDYSRAGLNVPQAIRDGKILEHEVLLRDHKGEILGRAPLNFSSFRFERITEQKKARRFLILPNATSVTVEEAEDPEPKTRIVAHIKNYTDRDAIPQSIELKRRPDTDYPVTLQVRMTLIDPYLAPLCKECLEDPLYREARSDYDEALARLRELEANPDLLQEDTATEAVRAPQELAQLAHKKAESYRASIKNAISRMNETSHKIKEGKIKNHSSNGNFIQYRQWHLYSRPYFFRVSTDSAN